MSHLTDSVTTVVSSDQNIVPDAAATFSAEVDFRGCLGGIAQVEFQFTEVPTADASLELFLLPGLGAGQAFDEFSMRRNISLGLVRVAPSNGVQRLSIPIGAVNAPYAKLALLNLGTGKTVTLKKLTVSVRRVE